MALRPSSKRAEYDVIEPIGKRVVVRKDDNKRQTKSGIVLPDSHEIPVITGRVIAISKAIENDEDQTIRQYDKVLFDPREAIPVELEHGYVGSARHPRGAQMDTHQAAGMEVSLRAIDELLVAEVPGVEQRADRCDVGTFVCRDEPVQRQPGFGGGAQRRGVVARLLRGAHGGDYYEGERGHSGNEADHG
jgi:chaperonin GroES